MAPCYAAPSHPSSSAGAAWDMWAYRLLGPSEMGPLQVPAPVESHLASRLDTWWPLFVAR
jgi:hypothetical protein